VKGFLGEYVFVYVPNALLEQRDNTIKLALNTLFYGIFTMSSIKTLAGIGRVVCAGTSIVSCLLHHNEFSFHDTSATPDSLI